MGEFNFMNELRKDKRGFCEYKQCSAVRLYYQIKPLNSFLPIRTVFRSIGSDVKTSFQDSFCPVSTIFRAIHTVFVRIVQILSHFYGFASFRYDFIRKFFIRMGFRPIVTVSLPIRTVFRRIHTVFRPNHTVFRPHCTVFRPI